ncbi:hypothetical protein ELH42_16820 [Rhizobium ruizarguesonis]|uniref:hypothetical protein n=1 Tax=Rhizobium ruizarguesonis TaxID=2081791 RepID=UPI0010300D5F|nr:hypothetical protein [Rhizobium ruizarguesonis]TBB67719.1 hypothetical protein ELH42_16820 [Rhizobium ruizarguesonis]
MNTIIRRRSFLQIAAAGVAATLPAAAEAATAEIPQLPQLSDQQRLDLCVDQLRSILQRLNPGREFADFVAPDGVCIHVRCKPEGGVA